MAKKKTITKKPARKFPPLGTLVLVNWEDSAASEGWKPMHEANEELDFAADCRTVGWLTSITPTSINLCTCGAFGKEGDLVLSSTMYLIPISAIRRVRRLRAQ